MMVYSVADMVLANRHVAEGERFVANEEMVISRLLAVGASTAIAEELLAVFHVTLCLFVNTGSRLPRAYLGRIRYQRIRPPISQIWSGTVFWINS
jgi:hypothetical protein